MNTLIQVKRDIIHVCRRLYERGLVASNDGNVSVRLYSGRLIVTPTGRSKGFLEQSDLVETDLDGRPLGQGKKVSTELKMHLRVYEMRPDVRAVVHAHPPTATGFAVAGKPLTDCILPEVVLTVGRVPIVPYGTPSTEEIPDRLAEFLPSHDAFLLANHGALTLGASVIEAYHKMESLEHAARIILVAELLGGAKRLGCEEVEQLMKVRQEMGLPGVNPGCDKCELTGLAQRKSVQPETPGKTPSAADGEVQAAADEIKDLIERITREVLGRLDSAKKNP